jgi:5-methylcytosine-specific restriction enzyme subunit McrC
VTGQVTLKPDITWWRDGRVAAVADCKYKLLDDGIGRAPDYYQALAYATAYDVPEAWLIYARFPGHVPAADVPIRHVDKTVGTFGIDPTGPIELAIEQVRVLGQPIVVTDVQHKVQLATL